MECSTAWGKNWSLKAVACSPCFNLSCHPASIFRSLFWPSQELLQLPLRSDGHQTQAAGAGGRSGRAEGVQVIRQAGEADLNLVAAAHGGGDDVQQAIAACDHNGAG